MATHYPDPPHGASHPAPPSASRSNDPRVYFDQVSGNWRYEDDEGEEWEWQEVARRPQSTAPVDADQQEIEEEEHLAAPAVVAPSGSSSTGSSSKQVPTKGHWVRVLDEDLIRAQQQAYSVAGVDESTPPEAVLRRGKKRKPSSTAAGSSSSATSSNHLPPSKRPKPITSLYVTGLPLDCTSEEIASVFSRYGLLLEDDSGKPRIKMYHDEPTGMFKGEALVVYFKPESVDLAINMLDETSLRGAIGQTRNNGPVMRVQRAQFPTMPTNSSDGKDVDTRQAVKSRSGAESGSSAHAVGGQSNGEASTSGNHPEGSEAVPTHGTRRNLTDQERKKIQKRVARMETKLTDWRDSDSEEEELRRASHVVGRSDITTAASSSSSSGRTVVLTKMFTLFELEQDPTLLLDLKEDVREECTTTIGPVTNVTLWDKEPEGIMTVKFTNPQHAQACVQKMKGRFFATRRIDAFVINSKPRFRKTTTSTANNDDSDLDHDEDDADHATRNPEEKRRKDQFGAWLEQDHEE